MSSSTKNYILVALLVLLTFSVYARVISHEFTSYDDPYYITENPMIREGLTGKSALWAVTTFRAGFWIPLTWISFLIDYDLFGLFPGGYLYVNLALHILNTLLVYWLLRRMTGACWLSFLAALLFGIHPIHVESVAWATERKDVLSALFFLMAILAYLTYLKKPRPHIYALLALFFVLSLMAKPMHVTFPLALLLLDYWPLDRWRTEQPPRPGRSLLPADSFLYPVFEKIPLLLISAFFSLFNIMVARETDILTSVNVLSPPIRLANAVVSCLEYLKKIIWPAKLGVLYPHPGNSLTPTEIGLAAAALALITVVVLWNGRKRRYLVFGWLWFLGILFPVSGLFQNGHQAMADRFVYIPMLGLIIIAVWGGFEAALKFRFIKIIGICVTAVILAALLIRTHVQINYWQNSLSLFTRTLAITENNYLMHDYAGIQLVQRGKLDEAYEHFQKAIAINPNYPDAYFNAGTYLMFHGRLGIAIAALQRSLELGIDGKNRRRAENNLRKARLAAKNPDELISILEKSLALKPADSGLYLSLAELYAKTGRPEKAREYYQEGQALRNRADLFFEKKSRPANSR